MTFCLLVIFFVPFPRKGYPNPCLPITFFGPQTASAAKHSILKSSTFFESSVRRNVMLINDPSIFVKLVATQHSF